jgi:hypothetical protein
MLTLAEEIQPLLTMATVMPESGWSNYHSLFQHHYHMYSVDNRGNKNLCMYQHILYKALALRCSPYLRVLSKYKTDKSKSKEVCFGGMVLMVKK